MAIASLRGFSFAGDAFTATVLYDDATLAVQSIAWQNLTARPGAVEVSGPGGFRKTYTVPAGTPQASRDVSGDGLRLTSRQGQVTRDGPGAAIADWPAGWSIQARWPA